MAASNVRGQRIGDPEARFWAKVDKTDTCWLWTAGLNGHGYGLFSIQGQNVPAHRFAYELCVGPIPDGLHIDHLCRTRNCVRPDHLEPVTTAENTRRGDSVRIKREIAQSRTHCTAGHELTPENTYEWHGYRQCKTCRRIANRTVKQRKKESA